MAQGAGREGVTTGSCAAAAAKAATLALLHGASPPQVTIPCPPTAHAHPERLTIPLAACVSEPPGVRATVIKDAGDDPDVTHGCAIQALVWIDPTLPAGAVRIDGGEGVGRVTLPGLPAPVGGPAINPAPLAQIEAAVREGLAALADLAVLADLAEMAALHASPGVPGLPGVPGVRVRIEVPDGRRLAEKTLNPRLGVVGGISILGTRGTVRPFSHGSWKETIRRQFAVLASAVPAVSTVVLSTGGQSERLCRDHLPGTPETAFIQAGDFMAFALRQAASRGMLDAALGLYFGKCSKLAQGIGFTHARAGALTLGPVVRWAETAGLTRAAALLRQARTARHAMDLLAACPEGPALLDLVVRRALAQGQRMAGCMAVTDALPREKPLSLTILLFDTANTLRLRRSTQDD
ncbi:cobalt-precorrin-5B (C(1))-methyltransferase [Megalodesulfovibrio paquesii]